MDGERDGIDKELSGINNDEASSEPATKVSIPLLVASAVLLALGVISAAIEPNPEPFQEFAFRVLIALGAAGMVAALIPGLLEMEGPVGALALKASGPIVVFVLLMYFEPGLINTPPDAPPEVPLFEPIGTPEDGATPIGTPEDGATPIGTPESGFGDS